jgi:hypothetical protein
MHECRKIVSEYMFRVCKDFSMISELIENHYKYGALINEITERRNQLKLDRRAMISAEDVVEENKSEE